MPTAVPNTFTFVIAIIETVVALNAIVTYITTLKGRKHLVETYLMDIARESDPLNLIGNHFVPRSSIGSFHSLKVPLNAPFKDTLSYDTKLTGRLLVQEVAPASVVQ